MRPVSAADPLPGPQLAAFVAAVECGSVQEAASALMLTQSAATKRIQALERTLGVELLQRSRNGVRPTAAGQVLYPDAKEALAALQRAEQSVRTAAAQGEQTLSLAASHTIGEVLLPGWLAAFRTLAPDVQAQVEIVNSPTVLARLRERRADLGFVEGTDDLGEFDALPLAGDELVVVVAAGHRWARRRSVAPTELAAEPFFARETGAGTLAVAVERLAAHGVALRPSLQMASIASLKRAVAGGGFTLLSRRTVQEEAAAGALVALPVRGVDLHRQLLAVRRRARRHGATATRLWRWLGDWAKAQAAAA
jgi:DNA-binding transcriptional LysR family regulator